MSWGLTPAGASDNVLHTRLDPLI